MSYLRTALLFLAVSSMLLPPAVAAQDVLTGYDAYDHIVPGNFWDFSLAPIPPDFFGPGSDPFTGVVDLQGKPLGSTSECPTGLNLADFIVARQQDAVLPGVPSSDTVPIELVSMDLVSIGPITVTYNGGVDSELWDVEVTLSQNNPSTGSMTINKTHQDGGDFAAEFVIYPRFTFVRQSDGQTLVLDDGSQVDTVTTAQNYPWVYSAPGYTCPGCSTNFIPGNDGSQEVTIALNGSRSSRSVASDCEATGIPTLSELGLILLAIVLFVVGSVAIVRKRRVVRTTAG